MVKNALSINSHIQKKLSVCSIKTGDDGTKFTLRWRFKNLHWKKFYANIEMWYLLLSKVNNVKVVTVEKSYLRFNHLWLRFEMKVRQSSKAMSRTTFTIMSFKISWKKKKLPHKCSSQFYCYNYISAFESAIILMNYLKRWYVSSIWTQ